MKFLVTGGNGFLGSHVVGVLKGAGYEIFAPTSQAADLRTTTGIDRALVEADPEVVVHLAAAVGGIGANKAHPGKFLYENAVMGLELMERSRLAGVSKFVTVGTACEYPEHAPIPMREESLWDGYPAPVTAPYGLAKRMLLAQGQAYRAEYGFNVIHLIPGNLYGPGDNFDPETSHVVPGMIHRLDEAARDEAPVVRCWGTGNATREFVYVEDAAKAIVLAAEGYDAPEPVNIGTGVELSIRTLAEKVAKLFGYEGQIEWDTSHPDGTPRRLLDVSRAETAFGFRAAVELDEGLERTVDWYRQNVAA